MAPANARRCMAVLGSMAVLASPVFTVAADEDVSHADLVSAQVR